MNLAKRKSSTAQFPSSEDLEAPSAASQSSEHLLRGQQGSLTKRQGSAGLGSRHPSATAGMAALTNPNPGNASAAGLTGRSSGNARDYDAIHNSNDAGASGNPEHRINIAQQPYNNPYNGHNVGNLECGIDEASITLVYPTSKELIFDAIFAAICLAVAIGVEQVNPTHKFILLSTLPSVSYPSKAEQVPTWSVGLYALLAPLLIFLVWKFFDRRRTWRDMLRIMLTFLIQLFGTAAILALIKVALGRLRPNFVSECWPDGVQEWYSKSDIGGYARCTTTPGIDRDIRKSFPSGHAGWSASGLGFLSFFFMGQLRAFVPGFAYSWRLAVSLIPAAGAVAVAVSRVVDYKHHPGDVWGGLALGFAIAYAAYRQLFQPFNSLASDLPKPQLGRR